MVCEHFIGSAISPSKAELNPICHLLALLGAHPILHISRIRVKWHEVLMRNCRWMPACHVDNIKR